MLGFRSFALLLSLLAQVAVARSNFIVVAHRGASGYAPEHSVVAVAMAHQMGVDYIEPDLVMSKDGILIVLHDTILEQTTNVAEIFPNRHRKDGHFYAVDFRWSELRRLDLRPRPRYLADESAGGTPRSAAQKEQPEWRFPPGFKLAGLKIQSFQDFLQLVEGLNRSSNRHIKIVPELKDPEFHSKYSLDIVKAFFRTLAKNPYWTAENVVLQCFDPRTLKRVRSEKLFAGKLLQLIEQENDGSGIDYVRMLSPEGLEEISRYAELVGPAIMSLYSVDSAGVFKPTQALRNLEKSKLQAIPYTHRTDQLPASINEKDLFRALKKSNSITGVFTDFPDRVIKWFR